MPDPQLPPASPAAPGPRPASASGTPAASTSFLTYLLDEYRPSAREAIHDHQTYLPAATYPLICQTRTALLAGALQTHLGLTGTARTAPAEVLDIGLYPGTQARALSGYFGSRLRLSGCGLFLDADFARDLGSVLQALCETDLDPFYAGLTTDIRIAFPAASFDAIYALEVFEHLISPLPLLGECQRLLRPGGILCLSTPNVANLGAIAQLVRGHSNYEALDASPMYQAANRWRDHNRLYAKQELLELAQRFGFACVEHRYYREAGAAYLRMRAGASNRLARWLMERIATCIPRFRDDQFLVLRRTASAERRAPSASRAAQRAQGEPAVVGGERGIRAGESPRLPSVHLRHLGHCRAPGGETLDHPCSPVTVPVGTPPTPPGWSPCSCSRSCRPRSSPGPQPRIRPSNGCASTSRCGSSTPRERCLGSRSPCSFAST